MNRYEPKHARCYCVAVAGAVATVASAGAAAYSANKQSKAAKEAQQMGAPEDRYGRKVEPKPYIDTVASEDNYINQIGDDANDLISGSLPDIFDTASRINTRTGNMRRRVSPDFYGTIKQEGKNIAALEKGIVPDDVVQSINRIVAENLGGAIDPSAPTGGFAMSATASDTARRLGLTSLDLMKTGMSLGPQWRSNVDSFLYTPEDAIRGLYMPALGVAQNTAQLQMQRDQNRYISDNNMERADAMPDPTVTGARNDALTFGALNSQMSMNQGDALAGLINAGAGLYSAVAPKPTTSASSGMITGAAARNARGVSPYRA